MRGTVWLTISESADCGEDCGIEDAAVIVEADNVEVDNPGRFARFDHEVREWQNI